MFMERPAGCSWNGWPDAVECAPKVLEAFAEHAAFSKNRREEQEESARRYKEAERLRKLDEAFAAREKRRIEFAEAVHERLNERNRLDEVLQHLEEGSVLTPPQF